MFQRFYPGIDEALSCFTYAFHHVYPGYDWMLYAFLVKGGCRHTGVKGPFCTNSGTIKQTISRHSLKSACFLNKNAKLELIPRAHFRLHYRLYQKEEHFPVTVKVMVRKWLKIMAFNTCRFLFKIGLNFAFAAAGT
ncbi:hypothetical protein DCM91_18845 [Chitinophaga costaii]|uniref:hypothetical protein n=1 Tax=Chitinophaga costaii TaxID=1335309 RepID=UPI000B7DCDC3|nr:hypothetical protein [Chitinophaga costaii]PUZ20494.1 hypothetical protein DCM91_18845 [Chitinophaga costaii]